MTSDDIIRSPNPTQTPAHPSSMGTFYCDHCQTKGRSVAGSEYRYLRAWRKTMPACSCCVAQLDAKEAV